jgi:hypothetical protein
MKEVTGVQLKFQTFHQNKFCFRAAYELALSLASEESLERLMTKGRQLTFTDDDVSPWGPGWEFSFGLQYKEVKFVQRNS